MADVTLDQWGPMMLRAVNASMTSRQTLEGLIADSGMQPEEDDMDAVAKAKEDEAEILAFIDANAPKCPGCRKAYAFQRQAKRPHLCSWCGYDHETGQQAQLVPAQSPFA